MAGAAKETAVVPYWPACHNCREWRGVCTYTKPTLFPWVKRPGGGGPGAVCGYWHGPDGETRRQRCAAVNRRLDLYRPPAKVRG